MGTEDVLKRKGTNHNFTLRHELAHCNGWKHPNTTNGKKFNVGDRWDEAEGAKWVPANTKVSMPKLPTSTRILPASPPVICVTPEWKPEPCKNRNAPIVGGQTVTKLLLASVLAIASTTAYSAEWTREQSEGNWGEPAKGKPWDIVCAERHLQDGEAAETPEQKANYDRCIKSQPAQVTVTPQYYGPPPIGWVYGPYTMCGDPPRCSTGVVNVPADGLNVRVTPNGPPVMSLVNGTPLIPLDTQGDWLLVAPACDLTPTWAWSWNAGVPLNRCWVYF